MNDLKIGSKLRECRKKKDLRIKELSEKSGVSVGQISEIERDIVSPSIVVLHKLAQALDIDISYFFAAPPKKYILTRKGEHRIITTNAGCDEHIMLNYDWGNRNFDFLIVRFKYGDYKPELMAHPGEEFVYIISGELTVLIGDETITMYPGDSICFSSRQPHFYMNLNPNEDCVVASVLTPVFFG